MIIGRIDFGTLNSARSIAEKWTDTVTFYKMPDGEEPLRSQRTNCSWLSAGVPRESIQSRSRARHARGSWWLCKGCLRRLQRAPILLPFVPELQCRTLKTSNWPVVQTKIVSPFQKALLCSRIWCNWLGSQLAKALSCYFCINQRFSRGGTPKFEFQVVLSEF